LPVIYLTAAYLMMERLRPPNQDPVSPPLDRTVFVLLLCFVLCSAFSIALTQIAYFTALVFWIARMVYERKSSIPRTPLDVFFLAYVCAEVLATVVSRDQLYSLLYLQRRILLLPVTYILLMSATTVRRLKLLVGGLLLSAVGVALWSMGALVVHFNDYLRFQRRLGEFQIYMTAGGIVMISLLLLIPLLVHPKTPRKVRWYAALGIVPLLLNLFFTFTRSSWLGFTAGLVVIGIRRTPRLLVALALLVTVAFLLSTPEIRENRIYSLVDPSHPHNLSRIHMWKTGMNIFLDNPLFGIGDIGIETVWDTYAEPGWSTEGHLHNNLIMWLVTLGLVGFAALLALFVRAWISIARIEKELREDWFSGSLALGTLAVLAGFHVSGLFEWNFGDAEIITLVWSVLGLTLSARRLAGDAVAGSYPTSHNI
jgi:O-antigen ligase